MKIRSKYKGPGLFWLVAFLLFTPRAGYGRKNTLYLVTGSHQDIGFGFSYRQSMDDYARQLKEHIELIEVDPEIAFSMGNTYNTKDFLERYPDYKPRLKNLLSRGKITTPAQWVGGEVGWCSGEFLVRTVVYPKYWSMSELDYEPHWYQLNDTPSLTPQLGQILSKSNVYLLQASHPGALPYALHVGNPWLFQGLDGSRVILYAVDYGDAVNFSDGFNNWDAESRYWASQWQKRFQDLPIKMSLSVTDRGTEASRSQRLKGYVKEWNERFASKYGFTTTIKTEEDFARYLQKELVEKKKKVQPITGVVNPWPWGGFSFNFFSMYRHTLAENLLPTVEKLCSFNELLGMDKYPAAQITASWEKILWYPEHNWAGGSDSDKIKFQHNSEAYETTKKLLHQSLKTLSGAVDYQGKGRPVLVFNPLNWKRTETVSLTLPSLPRGNWAVRDMDDKVVPAQLLTVKKGKKEKVKLVFQAKDVPSVGYKTFYLLENLSYNPKITTDLKAGKDFVENTFYKVTLHPDGAVKSIYDKLEDRELVNDDYGHKFANMDPYDGRFQKKSSLAPEGMEIVEKGPVRISLRARGRVNDGRVPVSSTVSLSAYTPWVEHRITMDARKKNKNSNFFYAAPFSDLADRAQVGVPYGSIPNVFFHDRITKAELSRRSPDSALLIADGRYRDVSALQKDIQKWLNIGDEDYSVDMALCNLQTRTYFKSNTIPVIHLAGHLPAGIIDWRFLIRGHKGDWREKDSPRFGWEGSNPLLAVLAVKGGKKARLPEKISFLELDTPFAASDNNLILTTFKKAFDGKGYAARFYEAEDQDAKAGLKVNPVLKIPRAEVSRTNLLELPFSMLEERDKGYIIPVLGYGIETVRFFPEVYTDTLAPAPVKDLSFSEPTSTTVQLGWTASGDDGLEGRAARYELRMSPAPLTENNWEKAAPVKVGFKPKEAGAREQVLVTNLAAGSKVYFALRVYDEAGNVSPLSNVAAGNTEAPDTVPPAAVENLKVVAVSASAVTLRWDAAGDDGFEGSAFKYMVAYDPQPVTEKTWSSARLKTLSASGGKKETLAVTGLEPATKYYFAVKAVDEVGNSSILSRSAQAVTEKLKAVVFQNGVSPFPMYKGCKDTHISSVNELEAEINYGESGFTRNWAGGVRSVLLKFTLDTIPQKTQIRRAYLKLYCYDITYGDEGTVTAYRVAQGWHDKECNWTMATSGSKWKKPGGVVDTSTDYGRGPNGLLDSAPVKDGGAWVKLDVTPAVRDWLMGKYPNRGFLIKANCPDDCGTYYRSAEYDEDTRLRPLLEVTY